MAITDLKEFVEGEKRLEWIAEKMERLAEGDPKEIDMEEVFALKEEAVALSRELLDFLEKRLEEHGND